MLVSPPTYFMLLMSSFTLLYIGYHLKQYLGGRGGRVKFKGKKNDTSAKIFVILQTIKQNLK